MCDFVSALALSNDGLQSPLSFGKVGGQSGLASSRRQKTTRHAESVLGLQRDTVEGGSILMPPPDSLSLMFSREVFDGQKHLPDLRCSIMN